MILGSALTVFVILALFCDKSISLIYPSVPCPNIFQYVRVNDLDMGLITLENVNYGETVLQLELSQSGVIYPGNEGYLNLNIDEDRISEYIESGRPITYKVNFPINNVVPQVTAIKVNGNTICYGQRVSGRRRTTIRLKHTLTTSSPLNHRSGQLNHQSGPNWSDQPLFNSRRRSWSRSTTPSFGMIQNQYPNVSCPNIFRYVHVDDLDMGLITIEGINYGETVLEIEMSQPGSIPPHAEGYLNLNINRDQIFQFIRSGQPITYKVNFPLRNVVPQVSEIRLNGNTICRGQRVGAPSTTITLKHTLTAPPPPPQAVESRGRTFIYPTRTTLTDDFRPTFNNRNRNLLSPTYTPPDEARNTSFNRNNGFAYTVAPQTTTTISPPITSTLSRNPVSATSTTSITTTPIPSLTSATTTGRPITLEYINSMCGRENFDFVPNKLAVRGETVPRARFPWIVAIYEKTAEKLSFQCGGSLISTRTVISAAHCFYTDFDVIKNEDVLVSLGRHNLTDWSDSYITHSDVENIIRHPDYRPELINIDADLAIVRLKNVVTFSQAIRPVCLWQGATNVRDIEGISGIVVGWGQDGNNSDVTSSPRLVTASVASELTCIQSNEQLFYLTSNRTLCAGNRDGTGPCNGDSGSGLMIRNRNRWMLRGTVSAALGSAVKQCDLDEYVVYTDIAMFIGWIKDNMLL